MSKMGLNLKLQGSQIVNFSFLNQIFYGFAALAAFLFCLDSFPRCVFLGIDAFPFLPHGQCPHLSQCVAQTVGGRAWASWGPR